MICHVIGSETVFPPGLLLQIVSETSLTFRYLLYLHMRLRFCCLIEKHRGGPISAELRTQSIYLSAKEELSVKN